MNDAALEISMFYGNPLSVISDCLRGFLVAKDGHEFIAADLSAIESRVVNWLAGEERVLDNFRAGEDIYVVNYSEMFGVAKSDVDKDQRQIGKVAELSLGFGGGKVAFQMMARNYGVKVADKRADEIKIAFRAARPKLVSYWASLENAAISATLQPGQKVSAGPFERRVTFLKSGSFLWCQLPSKRVLCYPYPKIEPILTPWGAMKDQLSYMGVDSYTNKWVPQTTYGGSLCENVTQSMARDILVEGMFNAEKAGFPVVMHVHDELVTEVKENTRNIIELEKIMEIVPEWAAGLPIAAHGWSGRRYRK